MRLSVPRLRRVLLGAGFLCGYGSCFCGRNVFSGAQSGCLHTGGSDRPAGCSALLPCCVHDGHSGNAAQCRFAGKVGLSDL